jgi:hypothetical protein
MWEKYENDPNRKKSVNDPRRWEHVSVVGEVKEGTSGATLREAEEQIRRFLFELIKTPGRTAAIGFTIVSNTAKFYLLTPSALFVSPELDGRGNDGALSVALVLARLAACSDATLGVGLDTLKPLTEQDPALLDLDRLDVTLHFRPSSTWQRFTPSSSPNVFCDVSRQRDEERRSSRLALGRRGSGLSSNWQQRNLSGTTSRSKCTRRSRGSRKKKSGDS